MKKSLIVLSIVGSILAISFTSASEKTNELLKPGTFCGIKDCGHNFEILIIESNKIQLSYKIISSTESMLALRDIVGIETIYIPISSIKVIRIQKVPGE